MAVDVKTGPESFEKGIPHVLFASPGLAGASGSGPQGYVYDVTRDGKRFLVIEGQLNGTPPPTVVTNWEARVRK